MQNNTRSIGIFSPVLAILPCFVYALLHVLGVSSIYAISTALIVSILGDVLSRYVFKNWIYGMVFMIITLSLIITLVVWLIFYNQVSDRGFYFVVFEIISVILLALSRMNKVLIRIFFVRKKDLMQKTLLRNFYSIGLLISYAFVLHLFLVLIFKFLEAENAAINVGRWNTILLDIMPVVLIFFVICWEFMRRASMNNKLKEEEWLPIITEKGDVTGKIAKSVSLKMSDKFRHPIVRTALICGDKIYLQERKKDDILCPGKLDYPFEKYTLFSHGVEEAVKNNIAFMLDKNKLKMDVEYILRYTYENEGTKRLIFLYATRIENEDDIKKTDKMAGKFWTLKQIEEGFADEIFAENFELEFEYLKNMVLKEGERAV